MKFVIVLAALVVCAFAKPQDVQTLKSNFEQGETNYKFEYDLSDGQNRQETGELKNVGTDNEALSVRGSFSFVGDDGVTYTINYIADENGFQPEGAHIPVAPSK